MKGLLFATILLSSTVLLTSGDIDVEAAIRREALSYGAAGQQVPRSRGDVRVDEDLDEPLPFLIAARRRTRRNDGRPLVTVPRVQDPLEKGYSINRMVMKDSLYADEPGFTDIPRAKENNLWNRIHPNDFAPAPLGKKMENRKQDDHRIRMRRRDMNDRTLDRRSKRPPIRISGQDFVIIKGKRNYLVNAEELSKMMVPWNDNGDDDDWTLAKSLESIEQGDHFVRRSTRSKQQLTLRDRINESVLFYPRKGKRTIRPTVPESTGSV